MKKRVVVAVVLAPLFLILIESGAFAFAGDAKGSNTLPNGRTTDAQVIDPQTAAFFDLVKTGSPLDVQAAIDIGVDVNARNEDGLTPLIGC